MTEDLGLVDCNDKNLFWDYFYSDNFECFFDELLNIWGYYYHSNSDFFKLIRNKLIDSIPLSFEEAEIFDQFLTNPNIVEHINKHLNSRFVLFLQQLISDNRVIGCLECFKESLVNTLFTWDNDRNSWFLDNLYLDWSFKDIDIDLSWAVYSVLKRWDQRFVVMYWLIDYDIIPISVYDDERFFIWAILDDHIKDDKDENLITYFGTDKRIKWYWYFNIDKEWIVWTIKSKPEFELITTNNWVNLWLIDTDEWTIFVNIKTWDMLGNPFSELLSISEIWSYKFVKFKFTDGKIYVMNLDDFQPLGWFEMMSDPMKWVNWDIYSKVSSWVNNQWFFSFRKKDLIFWKWNIVGPEIVIGDDIWFKYKIDWVMAYCSMSYAMLVNGQTYNDICDEKWPKWEKIRYWAISLWEPVILDYETNDVHSLIIPYSFKNETEKWNWVSKSLYSVYMQEPIAHGKPFYDVWSIQKIWNSFMVWVKNYNGQCGIYSFTDNQVYYSGHEFVVDEDKRLRFMKIADSDIWFLIDRYVKEWDEYKIYNNYFSWKYKSFIGWDFIDIFSMSKEILFDDTVYFVMKLREYDKKNKGERDLNSFRDKLVIFNSMSNSMSEWFDQIMVKGWLKITNWNKTWLLRWKLLSSPLIYLWLQNDKWLGVKYKWCWMYYSLRTSKLIWFKDEWVDVNRIWSETNINWEYVCLVSWKGLYWIYKQWQDNLLVFKEVEYYPNYRDIAFYPNRRSPKTYFVAVWKNWSKKRLYDFKTWKEVYRSSSKKIDLYESLSSLYYTFSQSLKSKLPDINWLVDSLITLENKYNDKIVAFAKKNAVHINWDVSIKMLFSTRLWRQIWPSNAKIRFEFVMVDGKLEFRIKFIRAFRKTIIVNLLELYENDKN